MNDAGPNVIQTDLKSEFCVVAGETRTLNTVPVAGFKPLLGMLCRSKKLDKTSRLVRIQHRIFRSLRGRETVLSLGKSVTSVYPRPRILQDMVLQMNPK